MLEARWVADDVFGEDAFAEDAFAEDGCAEGATVEDEGSLATNVESVESVSEL